MMLGRRGGARGRARRGRIEGQLERVRGLGGEGGGGGESNLCDERNESRKGLGLWVIITATITEEGILYGSTSSYAFLSQR